MDPPSLSLLPSGLRLDPPQSQWGRLDGQLRHQLCSIRSHYGTWTWSVMLQFFTPSNTFQRPQSSRTISGLLSSQWKSSKMTRVKNCRNKLLLLTCERRHVPPVIVPIFCCWLLELIIKFPGLNIAVNYFTFVLYQNEQINEDAGRLSGNMTEICPLVGNDRITREELVEDAAVHTEERTNKRYTGSLIFADNENQYTL